MRLSLKVILVIAAVLLVSFASSVSSSLIALKENQDKSINLSKQEFLNLSQGLFHNSSNLFFYTLNTIDAEAPTGTASETILSYIGDIDPNGDNINVINLSDHTFLPNYGHAGGVTLLDPTTVNNAFSQNKVNLTADFEFNNFSQFASDTTENITPTIIHFHVYNNAGLAVGYGDAFTAEKVRVEYLQEQSNNLFSSFLLLFLVIFAGALVLTTVVIFFFTRYVIIKPLNKINFGLEQIKANKLATRITVDKKDEIGEMADSFNTMASHLESYTNKIEEARARLFASISNLPLGFLLLDTTGGILLSNKIAQTLFSEKDQTLPSLSALFTPNIDISAFNSLIREKKSYELQEATMGDRSFHVMATPVTISGPGKNDEVIGSVILLEDITEEKRLEQSKDAFLAIAAHEMRTPLTVIRGNTELLLDDPSVKNDAEFKDQIESVLRASVRLLGIVNDFLDVQNLEGNRVPLKIEPVNIATLVTGVVNDLSELAKEKQLTLVLDIPPDLSTLSFNADKFRLQQIITNLTANAVNYTEKGGVTISLKKEEKTVKILFEDTGIGISPDEQVRLFKKFETGRAFMRSKEYGSGLGLYISRFLAHLMGGDVTLEKSEVGKGSVFCLTLPLEGIAKQ